ncbi:MAG: choice-of-anchor B family protein, partial [Planctomycetota bacterium]
SLIIDLNDLENVELVQSYTSGLLAVDHNQYVRNNLVFQANYTTGLRVFDASDPLAPTEVGYFDTYPANNSAGFSGLWSNFPYFPSGTVIGSGSGGLWVWQVNVDEDVPCPADANGDEVVDVEDMVAVILDWGCIGGSCLGDVNADGTVDVADLIEVVLAWGDCQ